MSKRHLTRRGGTVANFLLAIAIGLPLVIAPSPVWAQASNAGTDPDEAVRQAFAKYQGGDIEGAIADLEILREEGEAPPKALAALGALYSEIGLDDDAFALLAPLAEQGNADPAVLYNAGRAALALGKDDEGEGFLRRSVAIQPLSPAARLLGLRLGARGQTQLAYQLLRPWAMANPDDGEGRMAAAAAAVQLQRSTEADELLVGADDHSPRVRLLRAELALQRRDPTTALEQLRPFSEQAPPPEMALDVLQLMASAQLELGRIDDAIALLGEPAAGHPKLSLTLAKALDLAGQTAKAITTLEPFLAPVMGAEPEAIPAGGTRELAASLTFEQGRMLLATDRAAEALPLLERSAVVDPWRRDTWQELARARAAGGDEAGAQAALERFQQLVESRQQAEIPGLKGQRRQVDTTGRRLAEAMEWAARGEPGQALNIARQEIALTPRDPRPRLFEIRLLLSVGRGDEALAAADAAVGAFPGMADVRHFRAVTHLAGGDARKAEADLRGALELEPAHVPAKNDLALVLAGRGELDAARALLEDVLASNPDDAVARQRLDQLSQNGAQP